MIEVFHKGAVAEVARMALEPWFAIEQPDHTTSVFAIAAQKAQAKMRPRIEEALCLPTLESDVLTPVSDWLMCRKRK